MRFSLEAVFIVGVAVVAGFVHLSTHWIVLVMLTAWVLTFLVEANLVRAEAAVPLPAPEEAGEEAGAASSAEAQAVPAWLRSAEALGVEISEQLEPHTRSAFEGPPPATKSGRFPPGEREASEVPVEPARPGTRREQRQPLRLSRIVPGCPSAGVAEVARPPVPEQPLTAPAVARPLPGGGTRRPLRLPRPPRRVVPPAPPVEPTIVAVPLAAERQASRPGSVGVDETGIATTSTVRESDPSEVEVAPPSNGQEPHATLRSPRDHRMRWPWRREQARQLAQRAPVEPPSPHAGAPPELERLERACGNCGRPISPDRLRAAPTTSLCIECKRAGVPDEPAALQPEPAVADAVEEPVLPEAENAVEVQVKPESPALAPVAPAAEEEPDAEHPPTSAEAPRSEAGPDADVEHRPAVEAIAAPAEEPAPPMVATADAGAPREQPEVAAAAAPEDATKDADGRAPAAPAFLDGPSETPSPRLAGRPGRRWNVWELERGAREHAGIDAARDEEWAFLLVYLREFATPDGFLPLDFDALVRESFPELIAVR